MELKDTQELTYISKKTEKICSALYAITELMSDTEPLKWTIRDISSRAVGLVVRERRDLYLLGERFEAVRSLMRVGRTSGLISPMNSDIIDTECAALAVRIGLLTAVSLSDLGAEVVKERAPIRTQKERTSIPAIRAVGGRTVTGARKTTIIEYLRAHPGATIRDISTETGLGKECSEKTIQRELVALLAEQAIRREGERRWSRYTVMVSG